MNRKKRLAKELAGCLIFAVVLYLFYRSVIVLIFLIPFFFVFRKYVKKEEDRKYKEKLRLQFKDALVSISAALRAGYSIENSLKESYEEMKMMYGQQAPICCELRKMIHRNELGVPCEMLFAQLAEDSRLAEISTFAAVFGVANKTGGDMVEIIRKSASDIASKIDTLNEISVLITAKRFEQNIMNVVPMAIIVYVSLTSGGLLDRLYGNALGIAVMTACLGVYGFAFFLSRKIMDIKV